MSGVVAFLTIVVGLLLGWIIGRPLPPHLEARFAGTDWESIRLVIWAGTLPAALLMSTAVKFARGPSAPWLARRFVGLVCGVVVFFALLAFGVAIAGTFVGRHAPYPLWMAVYAGIVFPLIFFGWAPLQEGIGRLAKPVADLARTVKFGKGGSASFAGLLEEWRMRYKRGAILLGSSFYNPSWRVGTADDRGLLTIAASRAGKGRSAVIPNLILWPGSALVIDPKGTNAAVTAARRGHGGGRVTKFLGQEVHIVDPFGIVPGAKSASFNPLAGIDLKGDRATEDVGLVADALVVPGSGQDSHWDESARAVIAGLIAYLLASNKGASLVDLRAALRRNEDELKALFTDMVKDQSAGGLPATAATVWLSAGGNERGSFMTTVMRNIGWLDSVAIQRVLGRSDFDIDALKQRPMTIYVVLPPDLLDTHNRFMRLFVNMAIRGLSQGGKAKVPVLFLLDEFYSLGRMTQVEKAAGLLAGYGMRLWPIVQNLTQLQQLYPRNWETFLANAGVVQVFSTADQTTTTYLATKLGKRASQEKMGEQMVRVVSNLREPEEFEIEVGRERQREIIFRSGDYPLLLRRLAYDKAFDKSWYNPDPDYVKGNVVAGAAPAAAPIVVPPVSGPVEAAPALVDGGGSQAIEPAGASSAPAADNSTRTGTDGRAEAAAEGGSPEVVFLGLCAEKKLQLSPEAMEKLVNEAFRLKEGRGDNGDVTEAMRDLFARCVERQQARLAKQKPADHAARQVLIERDFPEG